MCVSECVFVCVCVCVYVCLNFYCFSIFLIGPDMSPGC